MVERTEYLNSLISWKNEDVIKVITGIRRCGKSTLLAQFESWLLNNKVSKNRIISINFEDLEYENLLDYNTLYLYIKERLIDDETTYIILDEIQKVPFFEKVVDSLYIQPNVDLYITGSNAYMLSGDLATLLTGRYIEIKMLPLSFSEFIKINSFDKEEVFNEYLKIGGFPYLSVMNRTPEKVNIYLEGIYNTVIINDIEDRQSRKEHDPTKRKVTDVTLLKSIAKYLSSVVGSPVSIKSITDYLNSNNRRISANTVNDYVEALSESFIFYPVERFDVYGKQLLKSNKKYYIVDLGLRNYILTKKDYDLGFSLENIVYFELLRRGYQVSIGKVGNYEVDFVAKKQGVYHYYQVSANISSKDTFDREIKPLKSINDNHEKYILTLDKYSLGNYDGIEIINLIDWLVE